MARRNIPQQFGGKKFNSFIFIIIVLVALFSNYQKSQNENSNENIQNQEHLSVKKSDEYNKLANLPYNGKQEVVINNNNPGFSKDELSTSNGPWESFGNLDNLNRVTVADALLNKSIMPHQKRERLYVNPTGFRNKKINGEWLYNRSHLIGYQLTGQNNNLKNLMTGTRSLNSPGMQHYEDDMAYYIRNHPNNYIRYQVRPIFRGNELVARGVQMRAQSIGSNDIHFNIFIHNIEKGVKINYMNGYSTKDSSFGI